MCLWALTASVFVKCYFVGRTISLICGRTISQFDTFVWKAPNLLLAFNGTYQIFVFHTDRTVKWSYKFRVWRVRVYDQPLISFVQCYSCGCIQLSLAAFWFSSFKAFLRNWKFCSSFKVRRFIFNIDDSRWALFR